MTNASLWELNDEELMGALRAAILSGSGHRVADSYLAGVAAAHLVNALRLDGLIVVRTAERPMAAARATARAALTPGQGSSLQSAVTPPA